MFWKRSENAPKFLAQYSRHSSWCKEVKEKLKKKKHATGVKGKPIFVPIMIFFWIKCI